MQTEWPALVAARSARLLGLRARIPPGAWLPVSCEYCVSSSTGLCFGLITCPEESLPNVVWVTRCDREATDNEKALTMGEGGGKGSPCLLRAAEGKVVFVPKHISNTAYRSADKSLARPGKKRARKHVRDARNFNHVETRAAIKFSLPSRQGAEGNSRHSDRNISLLPSWSG